MTFGALQLLENKQVNSGAELAQLLLDTFAAAGTAGSDAAAIDATLKVFSAFLPAADAPPAAEVCARVPNLRVRPPNCD